MTTPLPPLDPTTVYAILTPDNVWVPVATGTLLLFPNPQFNLIGGGPPQTIGGLFVAWQDSSGVDYAMQVTESWPLTVKWTPPAP